MKLSSVVSSSPERVIEPKRKTIFSKLFSVTKCLQWLTQCKTFIKKVTVDNRNRNIVVFRMEFSIEVNIEMKYLSTFQYDSCVLWNLSFLQIKVFFKFQINRPQTHRSTGCTVKFNKVDVWKILNYSLWKTFSTVQCWPRFVVICRFFWANINGSPIGIIIGTVTLIMMPNQK